MYHHHMWKCVYVLTQACMEANNFVIQLILKIQTRHQFLVNLMSSFPYSVNYATLKLCCRIFNVNGLKVLLSFAMSHSYPGLKKN